MEDVTLDNGGGWVGGLTFLKLKQLGAQGRQRKVCQGIAPTVSFDGS